MHPAAGRAVTLLLISLLIAPAPPVVCSAAHTALPSGASATTVRAEVPVGWRWPITPAHIVRPYAAPAHEYGPGHRGIDLAATVGAGAVAPASGVVAFSGSVAGRGVVTIDHGGGWVTTLEPVAGQLPPGTVLDAGQLVARIASGGHAPAGTLHFGVRHDGVYVNPMLLLGGIPRAVLLPCC